MLRKASRNELREAELNERLEERNEGKVKKNGWEPMLQSIISFLRIYNPLIH